MSDSECRRSDWTITTLISARGKNDLLYCVVCSLRAKILKVRGEYMWFFGGGGMKYRDKFRCTLTHTFSLHGLNCKYSVLREYTRALAHECKRGIENRGRQTIILLQAFYFCSVGKYWACCHHCHRLRNVWRVRDWWHHCSHIGSKWPEISIYLFYSYRFLICLLTQRSAP